MLAANLLTVLAVGAVAIAAAAPGGWSPAEIIVILCVLAATPWHAIGFWNSAVGLVLARTAGGLARAAPFLKGEDGEGAVTARTAILMTLRDEDPGRAIARLRAMKAALDATEAAGRFDYFVLSDTSRPDIAAAEERAMARWRREEGPRGIFYRRRAENTGFKAGNIRDFCATWGVHYDFMLPLDADSLMGASSILRMVRILERRPRIGILQSLVVGLPSASAFARVFQFGMRHGMRCYTLGAAWWAGDCGPYWGHNALVRIAPFTEHCHLPYLPGRPPLGGPILSHDQMEAVLMRRAGFEVRVMPVESESYEENPPALPDFLKRDRRWCLGNLQYLKLLGLPGLAPMSRFQLVWAIAMFLTVPAVPIALAALPFAVAGGGSGGAHPGLAAGLYLALLALSLSPKLAGLADVMLTPGGVARYGGAARFLGAAALEMGFSFLLGAVSALSTTRFLAHLAISAVRGAAPARWSGQARDAHAVSWGWAARHLWPVTLYGLAVTAGLAAVAPGLIAWTAPLLAGAWLAVPFAVVTAAPSLGAAMARAGLCATPEEFDRPATLAVLERELRPALRRAA